MGNLKTLVWDIFIEESMGEEKAQEYIDRMLDHSEDMSYITYRNVLEEINKGKHHVDISFDDVLPDELRMDIN